MNSNGDSDEERRQRNRERQKRKRSQETEEQRGNRLARNRERTKRRRLEQTEEERENELSQRSERDRTTRLEQTEEERENELSQRRERDRTTRLEQTEEERENELSQRRERDRTTRLEQTEEERENELSQRRERDRTTRLEQTEEERENELSQRRERDRTTRLEQTEEERENELLHERQRREMQRIEENDEERENRLSQNRERERRRRLDQPRNRITPRIYNRLARKENFRIHINSIETNLGDFSLTCSNCNALYFREENIRKCCDKGKVVLPQLSPINEELKQLLIGSQPINKLFRSNIRAYNSRFSFISLGHTPDNRFKNSGYNYSFSISGSMYHLIGPIIPQNTNEPKCFQIYFYEKNEQIDYRIANYPNLDKNVITTLTRLMNAENPLVSRFKSIYEYHTRNPVNNFQIKLIAQPGTRASPTADEVAVLLPGEVSSSRDIVVKLRSDSLIRCSQDNALYMPLAYPLIFLDGEYGWTSSEIPNTPYMSPAQHYRYRLHIKQNRSKLHLFGRLFQHYCVDAFVIVEQARLKWLRFNQSSLRTELYRGLMDAIDDGHDLNNIGQKFILPSSYTTGPRYMTEKFQDAMAIVGQIGKPHLFITMTCNKDWPEIKDNLFPGQTAFDRPDIVSRVFELKKNQLKDLILKKHIFGEVIACVYVIEFQKRGLPHMHMLIILKESDKPCNKEDIDSIVSAEIPNPDIHPEAHETVIKCMVHGPCGESNPNAQCMIEKDGRKFCSKGFPKQFSDVTSANEDGYPIYRRRNLRTKSKKIIE